jgi:penicillin-binding protein 1A
VTFFFNRKKKRFVFLDNPKFVVTNAQQNRDKPENDQKQEAQPHVLQQNAHCVSEKKKAGKNLLITLKKTLTLLACLTFLGCGGSVFILWKYGRGLSDYKFLQNYKPPIISTFYDRLGTPIFELAEERRIYAHLSDIPPLLIRAFISAEDKNYYQHGGLDLKGIFKAALLNTLQQRWKNNPIGGSTITQQVAKIFLVGSEHSFPRKIKEAILALRLEKAICKDKILELYLNQIYLGGGSYGVVMAAKHYFRKALSDLTLEECAFLASLPKSPGGLHQEGRYQKWKNRRNWVLAQMLKNHVITQQHYQMAQKTPLEFSALCPEKTRALNYYLDEARRDLIRLFGAKNTYTAGIEATLTIHPDIQKLTEEALRTALEAYDIRKNKWKGPVGFLPGTLENWRHRLKRWKALQEESLSPVIILRKTPLTGGFPDGTTAPLQVSAPVSIEKIKTGDILFARKEQEMWKTVQIPEITGGMIVLDPETGEILGLSGGYSFALSQFNCATQAFRQPGSTFKPFVYLAALQKGYTENSLLMEKPTKFFVLGQPYVPHNYDRDFYGGLTPLQDGLIKSRNVLTVILADKVGIGAVADLAQQLGFAEYVPKNLYIALGGAETTLMKLAGAYSTFFNGGKRIRPTLFLNIANYFGNSELFFQPVPPEPLIPPDKVLILKKMLKACVDRGTARSLSPLTQTFPINLYGKTGTSNDFKDVWFVGCLERKDGLPVLPVSPLPFSSRECKSLVIGVFMGFATPRSLGEDETGGRVATKAVKAFINSLLTTLSTTAVSAKPQLVD